mmetsp:Transcript_39014/g.65572  ORF Transcript_39014/g.65572 Transcript_39014/m.65572 type:complete len:207 (-) Transcript_39014:1545-2165(-)
MSRAPSRQLTTIVVELRVDDGPLVHLRGLVPRKVPPHPAQLYLLEGVPVISKRLNGVVHDIDQVVGLRALVVPPGTCVLVGVVGLHRVPEAADRVHDGHGPVALRVQLVEAARLEARGHQQDIARGVDAVGHLHREPHPRAELLSVAVLHVAHTLLEVGAAGAEEHHLALLPLEPFGRFEDLVHPLLSVQPPDEAQQGDVRSLGQA